MLIINFAKLTVLGDKHLAKAEEDCEYNNYEFQQQQLRSSKYWYSGLGIRRYDVMKQKCAFSSFHSI